MRTINGAYDGCQYGLTLQSSIELDQHSLERIEHAISVYDDDFSSSASNAIADLVQAKIRVGTRMEVNTKRLLECDSCDGEPQSRNSRNYCALAMELIKQATEG